MSTQTIEQQIAQAVAQANDKVLQAHAERNKAIDERNACVKSNVALVRELERTRAKLADAERERDEAVTAAGLLNQRIDELEDWHRRCALAAGVHFDDDAAHHGPIDAIEQEIVDMRRARNRMAELDAAMMPVVVEQVDIGRDIRKDYEASFQRMGEAMGLEGRFLGAFGYETIEQGIAVWWSRMANLRAQLAEAEIARDNAVVMAGLPVPRGYHDDDAEPVVDGGDSAVVSQP
jgi:hypothetical protein